MNRVNFYPLRAKFLWLTVVIVYNWFSFDLLTGNCMFVFNFQYNLSNTLTALSEWFSFDQM